MAARVPTVVVINAGSSSIKAAAYAEGAMPYVSAPLVAVQTDVAADAFTATLEGVCDRLLEAVDPATIAAVGHRIVHGGTRYTAATVVTPQVHADLEKLVPLAPLHQPYGLEGLRVAAARMPRAVQVACFDTAFHRTCPPEAMRFALPRPLHDEGIQRYGFHGLSYESVVTRMPAICGGMPPRAIVAHLGAGASLCAIRDGRSSATTMGFTPLDGLVMATRCGSLDPGVILHLAMERGLSPAAIGRLLTRESGLLGVSGLSGDMRQLLASDDPRAREAIDLFCYRAVREIGSLVAALGGLDAIVFTAGIGEHAPVIRRRIATGLGWLGLVLDDQANAAAGPRISALESRVSAWVILTDEQAVIAAATWESGCGGRA